MKLERIPIFRGDVMRFSVLARRYCDHCLTYRRFSPKTVENYHLTYNQYLGWLLEQGHPDAVASFTTPLVDAWAHRLADTQRKGGSIRLKLSILSSLGEYGTRVPDERGKMCLAQNPVRGVERPPKPERQSTFLYREEFDRYMAVALSPDEQLARLLLVNTWIRLSELCAANFADLGHVNGLDVLTVRVKSRGGHQRVHHKALWPTTIAAIQEAWLRRTMPAPEDPVLVNAFGKRYTTNTLHCFYVRVGRRAGITRTKTGPHRLRHTMSTYARPHLDLKQRADQLSHVDTSTVNLYDHLLPGESHRASLGLESLILGGANIVEKLLLEGGLSPSGPAPQAPEIKGESE